MFSLNNHLLLLFYYLTYPPTHYLLPTTHNIHHTMSLFLSIFLIFQNNTLSSSWPNLLLSNSNTVFGWSENMEDGKHRVKNSVFHCLAKEGKWGGWKTREKVFFPGPTIFILPNQEENAGEKSAFTTLLHKYLILESSKRKRDRVAHMLERSWIRKKKKIKEGG